MEHHHEDNAHYENVVVHNTQNIMENLQFGSQQGDFAAVGEQSEAIVGALVDNAGCKLEEHIEHGDGDDEELKYVKEKHQNEKQQNNHHYELLKGMGNGDGRNGENADILMGRFDDDDDVDDNERQFLGNGAANSANGGTGVVHAEACGDEDEVEIIKNDADFSTTSNATTSTTQSPGDDKDVAADLLQVEMKIEAASDVQHCFEGYMAHGGAQDELDEEEQSSLATNGTSSLSENQQQQQQQQEEAREPQLLFSDDTAFVPEQSMELNFDTHSVLNPEAKEFVPSFGSKPNSPVGRVPAPIFGSETDCMARHIFGERRHDDDFVAQSPSKERYVDMDAISLPAEIEFDSGAATRPHELAEDKLILGEDKNVDDLLDTNAASGGGGDCQDLNRQSPASFIDHGPETCVDLDNDIMEPMQPIDDVMKQSIYVENTQNKSDEPIEDILNTVQPLPIDSESLNESFTDEQQFAQQIHFEKEILNINEIEHVNQMNLQNDMESNAHAAEQTIEVMEHTAAEEHKENTEQMEFTDLREENQHEQQQQQQDQQEQHLNVEERSFLMDTSNPLDSNNISLLSETEASFEAVRTNVPNVELIFEEQSAATVLPPQTLSIGDNESHGLYKYPDDDSTNFTPSPHSTEEKHLVEETKEAHQLFEQDDIRSLERQLDDMHLIPSDDGNLAQMEPAVEQTAAAINENANLFSVSDHDLLETHEIEQKPDDELFKGESLQNDEQRILTNEPIHVEHIEHVEHIQHIEHIEQVEHGAHNDQQQAAEEVATEAFESKPETAAVAVIEEGTEPTITTTLEEPAAAAAEATTANVEEEISAVKTAAVAAATATAAAAAVGVVAKKAVDSVAVKKQPHSAATTKPAATATATKRSSTAINAAKPRPNAIDAKKSTTAGSLAAKPAASSSAANSARPRTAPAAAKRSIEKAAATTATTTTGSTEKPAIAARKTFTARPAPKATMSTMNVRPTTAPNSTRNNASTTNVTKTATARSTTAMRKVPAPTSSSTASTGVNSAKSRIGTSSAGETSAPTKPTTLGVGANAKPKHLSPRATLTSQLRKTGGGVAGSVATAPKSPTKPMAAAAAAAAGSAGDATVKHSVSNLTARTKTTATTHITSTATSSSSTTTTTATSTTAKRFVARPAPKFNPPQLSTTSATTSRRATATAGGATNGPSKTSTTAKRLSSSSPSKSGNSTKLSPLKSTGSSAPIKSPKAKEQAAVKSAKELKEVVAAVETPTTNGTAAIEETQLNGNSTVENGVHTEEVHHMLHHEVNVEHSTQEIINLIDD